MWSDSRIPNALDMHKSMRTDTLTPAYLTHRCANIGQLQKFNGIEITLHSDISRIFGSEIVNAQMIPNTITISCYFTI